MKKVSTANLKIIKMGSYTSVTLEAINKHMKNSIFLKKSIKI